MKKLFLLVIVAFASVSAYAQTSQTGKIYNLRQFGCKGDNSTNDTSCLAIALAAVTANGGELFVPSGTYLTDPMTTTANSIIIRGDGWGSVIKSRTNGALLTFDNSATTTHSITIRDIAFEGFGSGSSNNGIVISGANERFNWKLSNVKFSAFGGTPFLSSGGAIFTSSWEDIDIDQPSGASGHAFDVNGAQTNILKRTYVHNVATNKAAYRLRQGAWTLEAVNGIDSGTTANWGIFGQQTSDDGTDTYAQITFIGSNVEDWSATDGLIYRIGSFGSYFNTKFDTLTSGTYRAIKLNFVDANTTGIFDAESGFALNGAAAWTNGVPVHSYGVPFVSIGSTEISSYYDTNLAATISMSYINTALNGAQSRSTINIPRISLGTSSGQGLDGDFRLATDNTYDLGTSSGQRFRSAYLGTSLVMANGTTTVGGQNWTITGGASPLYAFNDGTVAGRWQLVTGAYAQLGTTSAHDLKFLTGGTARWNINSSGHLIVDSGSLTIGLAAGNRPTIGYFSTSVNVGIPGTSVGSLVFGNASNSNTLTLQSGTTGATGTWTLWTADGSSGECLKTNGSKVLSFGSCASGGALGGSGTTNTLAKFTAATTLGDSLVTEATSPNTVTIGAREAVTGLTINTDVTNTVASLTAAATFTKNDTNSRTFDVVRIKPTFNFGGSNLSTSVCLLCVDSTNTAVTGLTADLLKLSYGGSLKFGVDSAGAMTLASGVRQVFVPSATVASLNFGQVATDPSSPVNGDCVYQTGSSKFRCYENGAWTNMIGATPGLTSTQIAFGDGSNLLTSASSLTYNSSTRVMTVGGGAGTPYVHVSGVSDAAGFKMNATSVPSNQGGLLMPFVGGSNSSGPGIWWGSSASYGSLNGIFMDNGFVFQGASGTHDHIKFRVGTGTSSNGSTIWDFSPTGSLLTAGYSTSATNTVHVTEAESLTSTGTAAAGLGISRTLAIENGSGSNVAATVINHTLSVVTAGAETAKQDFQNRVAGSAPATVFTLEGKQNYGVHHTANVTGSITIDLANGNVQTLTLTGNVTAIASSNMKAGAVYIIYLACGATPFTAAGTSNSTMKYAGGSFVGSNQANSRDQLICTSDGTALYCGNIQDIK